LAAPIARTETVPAAQATGRVIAKQLHAARNIPAHTNAAVDGYAFPYDRYDPSNGSAFPIAGRAAAGDEAYAGAGGISGGAIRIFTGAVMPPGCDTVAMQEDCRIESRGGTMGVFIPGGLKKGANRRKAGEDMQAGAVIAASGQRLRPQDAAALAAAGFAQAECFAPLRVAIFSTGQEIVKPGLPLLEGQVFDANAAMLAGLLQPLPVEITDGGILPDHAGTIRTTLSEASRSHDAIVTSGGASLGEEDHVVNALRALGDLSLWQIAIKPGRPMGVGRIGSCIALALPGNPVAVFVCTLVYVWPVLCRLAGMAWLEPPRWPLPAAFNIDTRKTGRREFFRGWLEKEDGHCTVHKYARDGSGLISSLRAASGLIEIEEQVESVSPGQPVSFIPFSAFGII
jgi:molybdopterin molybdotransferase